MLQKNILNKCCAFKLSKNPEKYVFNDSILEWFTHNCLRYFSNVTMSIILISNKYKKIGLLDGTQKKKAMLLIFLYY